MNKTLTKEGLEYIASRVKTAGTLKDVKVDGSSVVTDGIASINLTGKQDRIEDLATIREGAEKGATALQEVPADYRTSAAQDLIDAEKASKEELSAVEEKIPSLEGYATEQWVEDKGYLTEHQSLADYRTSEDQDAIDAEKADKSSVYTKEEIDEKLDDAGKITDVTINGESVVADKVAEITLKTIGGEAITGDGDIAVNAMSVVEVLPTEPSETTLYKLTKDVTHTEPKIVIDPTTGEEIEVQVTIVDFAKGLYVWLDGAWKSVLADSTAVNYETLINKPRINGKILTGNRSAADLGLLTDSALEEYQKKDDESLETTEKTIVGAINELKAGVSTVYKYKGSVQSVDDLPSRASVGDSYYVEDELSTYAYNGEAFLSIGGTADLSSYQKKTDSALKTTNKTVTGAINEVRTTAQTNKGAIEEVKTLIGEEPLETEAQTITEAINEIAKGGGGTGGSGKITLNGEETEVTPEKVNIYAPLAGGEKSRVLTGNALGAPTWETSCRSVTLTKAEYDDLSTTKKQDPNIIYYITDDVAGTTEDPNVRWSESLKSNLTSATDDQFYTAKAMNDILSSALDAFFDQVYPIGTQIVASMKPTRGTWTEVTDSTGRALWLQSGKDWGSTIAQGLPDIQGTFDMGGNSAIAYSERGSASGAFTQSSGSTSGYTGTQPDSRSRNVVTFKASAYNSIYGASTKVQPAAYCVRVWRRTA